MLIAPYTTPNSIDTVIRTDQRILKHLPIRFYRVAEVFACLQTLDEAMQEVAGKSNRRDAAIASWRELVGDLLHAVPELSPIIPAGSKRPALDPFLMARKDYPYSGNPELHCCKIPQLLTLMAAAARSAVGEQQRYTNNYHGVIFYQLWQLRVVTEAPCAEFHDKVVREPMPKSCTRSGLVYLPEYDPDITPRDNDDQFDLSDYQGHPHF